MEYTMGIARSYVFEFKGKPADLDDIIQFIPDKKIECVFFDFGGTLVDLRPEAKEKMVRYINIAGQCSINQDILEQALAAEWRIRRKDPIDQKTVTSVMTLDDEEKYWLSFYSSILRRFGLKDENILTLQKLASLQTDPSSFEVFPFFEDLMSELNKIGIKVGIISNAFPSARKILSFTGLTNKFDTIILSYEHNIIKPELEIYRKAANRMALEPSKILFIDDRKSFVDAAVKCGMQGGQITHRIISANNNTQRLPKKHSQNAQKQKR